MMGCLLHMFMILGYSVDLQQSISILSLYLSICGGLGVFILFKPLYSLRCLWSRKLCFVQIQLEAPSILLFGSQQLIPFSENSSVRPISLVVNQTSNIYHWLSYVLKLLFILGWFVCVCVVWTPMNSNHLIVLSLELKFHYAHVIDN